MLLSQHLTLLLNNRIKTINFKLKGLKLKSKTLKD